MADDDFSGFGTQTAVQEPQVSDTSDTSAAPPSSDFSAFGTEADASDTSDTFKPPTGFVAGRGTRINARFNNPGALGPGPSAREFGGYPSGKFDTGHSFMAFPSPTAGAAAQFRLWQNTRLYQGHTLADAIKSWIGPGEHGEAEFIASKLGIPLNTVISEEFLKGPQGLALMKAQATYEGENALTDQQWLDAQRWAYGGQRPAAGTSVADFSGFGTEQATPQTQKPATKEEAKKDDFSGFGTEGKPEPKKDETAKKPNPFADFWNNLFGTAGQTGFGLDVAKAKQDLNRALSEEEKPTLFGAEKEKEDQELKNPNISQADAQEIIERRRQRTEMDKQIAQRQLKRAEAAQAEAEKIEPGPAYQRTIPGKISSFLGSTAPFLMSGSLGAAAPITMATQMSEQAYGDSFDRNMKQGRVAHPDWSEERLRREADKVARQAAQTGFENGVVLSMLHIPKVGGLISQLLTRLGLRGTFMVVAGASQDIEENIQTKKGIDQNQSIYEGVLKHALANFGAGVAFEAPGAVVEGVRGIRGTPERATLPPEKEPTLKGPPPPEPPPVEPKAEPSTEDPDGWVSAIANRYSQERAAQGEIGEVAPGQGYATTDLIRVGERMKPEEINQHISDLMHDTGDPKLQAAAVRVEEARLSEHSYRLSRISGNNPTDAQAKINADNAFNDLTDFHNGPVAKLKNNWHAIGMTLQGEVPVDVESFNGLRDAWLRDVGKEPSEEVQSKMRDTVKRVREARAAEDLALKKVGEEAVKSSLERRLARAEEVRNNIMERLKDDPCINP